MTAARRPFAGLAFAAGFVAAAAFFVAALVACFLAGIAFRRSGRLLLPSLSFSPSPVPAS